MSKRTEKLTDLLIEIIGITTVMAGPKAFAEDKPLIEYKFPLRLSGVWLKSMTEIVEKFPVELDGLESGPEFIDAFFEEVFNRGIISFVREYQEKNLVEELSKKVREWEIEFDKFKKEGK